MIGTRVEIDLDALSDNYNEMKKLLPKDVKIAAVVKANAYGHDLVTISRCLEKLGADYLAVANIHEANLLRKSRILSPILVMGKTFDDYFELAVQHQITLTLVSIDEVLKIKDCAALHSKKIKIHLKYDTGFNRIGFKSIEAILEAINNLKNDAFIEIEGIFTHLALKDAESDTSQFDLFDELIKQVEQMGIQIPLKHVCDSIGSIAYPKKLYDMVRLGAILYGYCSRTTPFELKPCMCFKTNISQIKELQIGEGVSYDYTFVAKRRTVLATLPVGYGDGLPRNLSNQGYVSLHGRKAPIVGVLCMDQCMVDITDIISEGISIHVGDEVILFGDDIMTLTEVSKYAKTNRNELLARISIRVPRVILESGKSKKVVTYGEGILYDER